MPIMLATYSTNKIIVLLHIRPRSRSRRRRRLRAIIAAVAAPSAIIL